MSARTIAVPEAIARELAPTCVVTLWRGEWTAWPTPRFHEAMERLRARLERHPDEDRFAVFQAAVSHAIDVPVEGGRLHLPQPLIERASLEGSLNVDLQDGILWLRPDDTHLEA